jgi:hypothetical protein
MIIIDEERASDSPFVERIWRSHSEGERAFLSIAVNHCEFVVSRLQGKVTGRFIGQTPAQLLHHSRPEQLSFLYKTTLFP